MKQLHSKKTSFPRFEKILVIYPIAEVYCESNERQLCSEVAAGCDSNSCSLMLHVTYATCMLHVYYAISKDQINDSRVTPLIPFIVQKLDFLPNRLSVINK